MGFMDWLFGISTPEYYIHPKQKPTYATELQVGNLSDVVSSFHDEFDKRVTTLEKNRLANDRLNISDIEDRLTKLEEFECDDFVSKDELPDFGEFVKTEDLPDFDEFVTGFDPDDLPDFDDFVVKDDLPDFDEFVKSDDLPEFNDDFDPDNLVTKDDLPDFDEFAMKEDLPDFDEFAKSDDLPDFDEFAKTDDLPNFDEFVKGEDLPDFDKFVSVDDDRKDFAEWEERISDAEDGVKDAQSENEELKSQVARLIELNNRLAKVVSTLITETPIAVSVKMDVVKEMTKIVTQMNEMENSLA